MRDAPFSSSLRGAGSTSGGAAPESQTNSIEAQISWLTDLINGIFLYEFRREQCATKLCDDHTLWQHCRCGDRASVLPSCAKRLPENSREQPKLTSENVNFPLAALRRTVALDPARSALGASSPTSASSDAASQASSSFRVHVQR